MKTSIAFVLIVLAANALLYFTYTFKPQVIPKRGSPGPECVDPTFSRSGVNARSDYFQIQPGLGSLAGFGQTSNTNGIAFLREATRDKWIHFIGDSTLREAYYQFVSLMKREPLGLPLPQEEIDKRFKNRHKSLNARIGSSRVSFTWAPYCGDVGREWNSMGKKVKSGGGPAIVVMTCGLWDLLYSNQTAIDQGIETLNQAIKATHFLESQYGNGLLFKTSSSLLDSHLSGHRLEALHFRDENVLQFNRNIYSVLSQNKGLAIADGHALVASNDGKCDEDGIHSVKASITTAQAIAAYSYCVIQFSPFYITPNQLSLLIVFLFVVALYSYMIMGKYAWFCQGKPERSHSDDDLSHEKLNLIEMGSSSKRNNVLPSMNDLNEIERAGGVTTTGESADENLLPTKTAKEKEKSKEKEKEKDKDLSFFNLNGNEELTALLWAAFQLGAILLFVYFMDSEHRLSWPIIGDKTYVRDTFIFICIVILLFAIYTIKPAHTDDVLNRDQTEEWKGWMQILFVLYHYFAAKEMYNMIRVFIGAYVWMTGYGNYLFFARQNDFSFTRLMKMLFRLNFFVTFVCLAMNREFMQYYVCALHTTFFLMVYIVMFVRSGSNNNNAFLLFKFLVCFFVLYLVFDSSMSDSIFKGIFGWNPLFILNGSLHEWQFRSSLDHYATLLGMFCGWLLPRFVGLLNFIEKSFYFRRTAQASIAFICLLAMGIWWEKCLLLPKAAYNAQHAYTNHVAVIAFVILRNIHPTLRKYVLFIFTWCGKITLETYILQFHIWLSDDAGTIIHYFAGYPLLNFVFATIIYIALSKVTFDLTTVVSDALIPKNCTNQMLLTRAAWIAAIWFSLYNFSKLAISFTSPNSN